MSHAIDECYSEYEETTKVLDAPCKCCACKETIASGVQHTSVFVDFDGDEQNYIRCWRCQLIHEHLRRLGSAYDMWPDEDLNCGLSYEGEWECEPPDEIAALAFASASRPEES